MNKKSKNKIKEDEMNSLINDLKSLPSVKIPPNFDEKLRNTIALKNTQKESGFFSYQKYQRWLVYGFSVCIVSCLIMLTIMLINKQSAFNTLDNTFIHDGKKVTVIPPPNNDAASSVGNTVIGTANNNSISPEKKEEYFIIKNDSNISKTAKADDQTKIETEGINLDSINNTDSIERKLDSQKVNIKKLQN